MPYCLHNGVACIYKVPAFEQEVLHQRYIKSGMHYAWQKATDRGCGKFSA